MDGPYRLADLDLEEMLAQIYCGDIEEEELPEGIDRMCQCGWDEKGCPLHIGFFDPEKFQPQDDTEGISTLNHFDDTIDPNEYTFTHNRGYRAIFVA